MKRGMLTSTPQEDGYRMPAEFEKQRRVWMCWPERYDVWRNGAKPARLAFARVANTIAEFEPVTMITSEAGFSSAKGMLGSDVDIIVLPYNDAWVRDTGPTFLINADGNLRAVDWTFNAWGGNVDGLYHPWDDDDRLAGLICDRLDIARYRTEGFVLEGGSFHVDGKGTLITTEMCLLSKGRNPHLNKSEIEKMLKEYLGVNKVIWLKDGIDPDETNGHIDDVASFVGEGEVVCIDEENSDSPFYYPSKEALRMLDSSTDCSGRKLKVHRLCCPKNLVRIPDDYQILSEDGSKCRRPGDICIASYANFLIVNGGVIVPQYGDENDERALLELQKIFSDRKVIGVDTREIVYGGGNIHCITQQQPFAG